MDFETVDGGTYSVLGGRKTLLSELLNNLYSEQDNKDFYRIENVKDVYARESEDDENYEIVRITKLEVPKSAYDYEIETIVDETTAGKVGEIVVEFINGEKVSVSVKITGTPEASADNVTITAADGSYLPEDAVANAQTLSEEAGTDAVAAVEALTNSEPAVEVVETENEETVKTNTQYSVFDISLDNVNEEEYEGGFNVSLTLPEKVIGKDFRLYHIHDGVTEDITETMNTAGFEITDGVEAVSGISFTTDGFSEFVLSYTVDFEYTDPETGETHQFHMPGNGKLLLSQLFIALFIKEDVAEVVDVTFSDDTLVKVEKLEDDWLLTSLKPFDTEETLTIRFADGHVLKLKVTDDQSQAQGNLKDLLKTLTLRADGNQVSYTVANDGTVTQSGNDEFTVKPRTNFDLSLRFQERSGDSIKQFTSGEMVFDLPAGLDFTGYDDTDVTLSFDGTDIKGNHVWVDGGKLHIDLNEEDPNWSLIETSGSSYIDVDVHGRFGDSGGTYEFIKDVDVKVNIDTTTNAKISKSGNYDSNRKAMHYTITVESEGATSNISLTDTLRSSISGLQAIDEDTVTVTSNKHDPYTGATVSVSNDGQKLTGSIANMENGEKVTIDYYAPIDTTKVPSNGKVEANTMGNGVTMTATETPDGPDDNTAHVDQNNEISFSSFSKTNNGVDQTIWEENGIKYKTVNWKIVSNSEKIISLAGTKIKDKISDGSKDIMDYSGTGITITVDKGGETETRIIPWNQLNLNNDSWEYTIPADDGAYSYVIEYTTKVKITGLLDGVTVKNEAEGVNGKDHGGAGVGPKEEEKFTTNKKLVSYNNDEAVWKIDINVPSDGYETLEVFDRMPRSGQLFDNLDTTYVLVEGLTANESYSQWQAVYENEWVNGANVPVLVGYKLIFSHDGGTNNGLKGTGSPRTVSVTLKTNINDDWVDAAGSDHNKLWHQNEAKVTANGTEKTVSDGFNVAPEGITKENGGMRDIVMNDGTTRKLYKFVLKLSGVDRTTDDPIVIKDYFNTDLLEYLDPTATSDSVNSWQAVVQPGWNFDQFDQPVQFGIINVSDLDENGKKGVTLSIEKDDLAKKSDDHWFPVYKIEIYLVTKEAIANEALQHEGHLDLKNTADWKTESEVDFSYDYPGMTKQMTSYDSKTHNANFKLVINPDKATMNQGNNMTLVDAYLNDLSIDYETIRVVTDPAGMEVSYDATTTKPESFDISKLKDQNLASNMSYLVFDIPDNTKITITYQAKLVGEGNLNIYNTALLNGHYQQTVDDWENISGSASGGGSITKLRLLKYEKDHMENTLGGVKFALYAADDYENAGYTTSTSPETLEADNIKLKTFTTATAAEAAIDATKKTKTGMVEIILDQSVDGTELIRGKKYILRELTTPTGYASDNTEYEFTIPEDGHPNYSLYYYMNNDVLNVKNTPHGGLKIIKSVRNATLTDEQKQHISFKVTRIKDANGAALEPVEPIKFTVGGVETDTLTFDQFVNNNYMVSDNMAAGTYEVEEINTDINGYDLIGASVRVDKDEAQTATNLNSVKTQVVLTNDDITNGTVHAVSFVNSYESVKLTVFKNDEKGNRLAGAKFKMTKNGSDYAEFEITEDDKDSGHLFTGLTEGEYVLTETEAPEGYQLITEPVKFTVAVNDEDKLALTYNTPEAEREGYVAFAQTSRMDNYVTVKNEKIPEKTEVILKKKWVDLEGKDITDEYKEETLTVDLMRRVYGDPVFIDASLGLNSGKLEKNLVVSADSNVTLKLKYLYGVQGGDIKANPALTFTDEDSNELTITPTTVYDSSKTDTDITYVYDLGTVSKNITIGGNTSANRNDVEMTIEHTSTPMREEFVETRNVTWNDSTTAADHWSTLFDELDMTGSEKGEDGMRHSFGYEYYIVEKNGVIPVEEVNNDGIIGGTITITNKQSKTEIEVEKIWKDENGEVITGTIDKDSVQMEIYQVEHRTPDERDEYYTVDVQFGANGMEKTYAKKIVAKGTNVKVTYQTTNDPSKLYAHMWFPTTVNGSDFNNLYTDILEGVSYRQDGQIYICEYTLVNVSDDTTLGFTIGSNVPEDYQYYKVDWPEAGKATEGTKYGDTITVLKTDDWKKTVKDLPLYAEKEDGSIVYYTYYVEEVPVEGYGMSYSPEIDLTTRSREVKSGKIEVTNQQFYKETSISVEKKWKDKEGQEITDASKIPLQDVDIDLYQVEWEEDAQKPRYFDINLYYDADATATTLRDTITVEKDKEVTYTVTAPYATIYNSVWAPGGSWYSKGDITDAMNKPVITTTGPNAAGMYTHTFTVKAVRSLNVGVATGSNTSLDKVTVTATSDGESSMRSDGVLYGTYTLKGSEDWTKVIDGLPQKAVVDGRRVTYTYYVVEKTKVPRFEVTYSPTSDVEGQSKDVDEGTVTLTNTEVDEYVLEVDKTWFRNDGTTPIEKDGSIEFDVLQAETIVNTLYKVTFDYGQNAFTGIGHDEKDDISNNSVVTVTMRKRTINYNGTSLADAPTTPVLSSNDDIKYYNIDTGHDYNATSVKASLSEWNNVGSGLVDYYGTMRPYTDFEATVGINITGNTAIICNVADNDAVNNYYTVTWPEAQTAEAIDWENAPVYHTYTISSGDGWKKTIGLPKTGVDADGNDVEYRYLVREHAVDGYASTITGNTEDGIVFSQDSANVTIKNTKMPSGNLKIKKNFNPTTVSPEDASKLVFKVYGPYENEAAVPDLENLEGVEPKVTVTYDQFTDGEYTIDDLVLGTYLVVESGHDATGANALITDYHFVEDGSTTSTKANLVTDSETVDAELTNKYEEDKGGIVITKKVRFNGGAADTDEKKAAVNKTFKFAVKKDGNEIQGSPFEITVTDGSQNTIFIPDLVEGDYTIEEIDSNGLVLEKATGGKTVENNVVTVHVTKRNNTEATVTSNGKASFTNDLLTTNVDVNKTWLKDGVNYSGKLEDMFGAVTVNFDIVKVANDATDDDIADASTAKDVFGVDATGSMTGDTWTAKVSNLPTLGENWKYVIRETSVKDGKREDITAKFTTTLTNPTTINNAPETTDVTVSKEWSPAIPENASVTLVLYKGKTVDTADIRVTDITLNGEKGNVEYINSSDHSEGKKQKTGKWSATFSDLPKYGFDETEGVYPIAYVIKEDSESVPDGYRVVYADDKTYAISGGTITNTFIPVAENPEGTKELAGREWKEGDSFSFTLTPSQSTTTAITAGYVVMPTADDLADNENQSIDNNNVITVSGVKGTGSENASITFPDITFKKTGSYTFTMQEVVPESEDDKLSGITYATNEVTVTFTVTTDPTTGNPVVETSYSNESVNDHKTEAYFINEYNVSGNIPFKAKKTLTNGEQTAGQFKFTLTETDKNWNPLLTDVEEPETPKVKNQQSEVATKDTAGNVEFTPITLSSKDAGTTRYFTIKEDIPEGATEENNYTVNNIKYDPTVYRIAVEITDAGDGTLSVSKTVTKFDGTGETTVTVGEDDPDASFTNEELKDFTFYKVWQDTTSVEVEWGNVTSITVTVGRKAGETIDSDFSFTYEVARTAFTAEGTPVNEKDSTPNAPTLKAILIEAADSESAPQYKFYMDNLPKKNGSDVEYQYFVTEEQVTGYAAPNYGTSNENGAAYDKGYIINKPENSVSLPETGGRGTLPFTISGSILLAFSALMYVTSFRRRREEALVRAGGYFESDAQNEAMRGGGSRR